MPQTSRRKSAYTSAYASAAYSARCDNLKTSALPRRDPSALLHRVSGWLCCCTSSHKSSETAIRVRWELVLDTSGSMAVN